MTEPMERAPRPKAVCILGMHRSGTSALAGMLSLLGADFGRHLAPGGQDNPKGFWEHRHIVRLHVGLTLEHGSFLGDLLPLPAGWENRPETQWYQERLINVLRNEFQETLLWGFKDPRTCLLLPMWHRVFDAVGVDPVFPLIIRHPDEVALSMNRREKMDYSYALLVWLLHVLESERNTRSGRRVVVSYGHMMADWRETANKIATALEINWPRATETVAPQIDQFLEKSLRHEFSKVATIEQAARLRGCVPLAARWAMTAHNALALAAIDSESRVNPKILDEIQAEVDQALPTLAKIRAKPREDKRFSREYLESQLRDQ